MSFDQTSAKGLTKYDPNKPHTHEFWWLAHGAPMFGDAGLLFTVEQGQPTPDLIARYATSYVRKHGAPDDLATFLERVQDELFQEYETRNSKAYGMLMKCLTLQNSPRAKSMIENTFSKTRDAHGLLAWLAADASPRTQRRQKVLALENNKIERLEYDDANEPMPFDVHDVSADTITSFMDYHWNVWSNLLTHATTDHGVWVISSLRILTRVPLLQFYTGDALLRLERGETVFADRPDYIERTRKHAEFTLPARAGSALSPALRFMARLHASGVSSGATQDDGYESTESLPGLGGSDDDDSDDDEPSARVLALAQRGRPPQRRPPPSIPSRQRSSPHPRPRGPSTRTPSQSTGMKVHRLQWCQFCHCQACSNKPDGPRRSCAVFGTGKPKPDAAPSQLRYYEGCGVYHKLHPEITSFKDLQITRDMIAPDLRVLQAAFAESDDESDPEPEPSPPTPSPTPSQRGAQVTALIAQTGMGDMLTPSDGMDEALGIPPESPDTTAAAVATLGASLRVMAAQPVRTPPHSGTLGVEAPTSAADSHAEPYTPFEQARRDALNEPSMASGDLGTSDIGLLELLNKNPCSHHPTAANTADCTTVAPDLAAGLLSSSPPILMTDLVDMQCSYFADDLPVGSHMLTWSNAQLRMYFESGGQIVPCAQDSSALDLTVDVVSDTPRTLPNASPHTPEQPDPTRAATIIQARMRCFACGHARAASSQRAACSHGRSCLQGRRLALRACL